jgi:hypothetical protein
MLFERAVRLSQNARGPWRLEAERRDVLEEPVSREAAGDVADVMPFADLSVVVDDAA